MLALLEGKCICYVKAIAMWWLNATYAISIHSPCNVDCYEYIVTKKIMWLICESSIFLQHEFYFIWYDDNIK